MCLKLKPINVNLCKFCGYYIFTSLQLVFAMFSFSTLRPYNDGMMSQMKPLMDRQNWPKFITVILLTPILFIIEAILSVSLNEQAVRFISNFLTYIIFQRDSMFGSSFTLRYFSTSSRQGTVCILHFRSIIFLVFTTAISFR